MLIILGTLLIVLLIILILLLLIVKVDIKGHLYLNNINLMIKVKVLKITVFKYHVPLGKLFNQTLSSIKKNDTKDMINKDTEILNRERLYQLLDMVDEFVTTVESHNISQTILKGIHFKNFTWHTVVGLGEADLSAISVGFVWMIKAQLIRILRRYIPIENKMDLNVIPEYQQLKIGTDISCMMTFRVGKAIIAAYRIVKQFKGGNQSDRTSDTGFNENSHGESAGND